MAESSSASTKPLLEAHFVLFRRAWKSHCALIKALSFLETSSELCSHGPLIPHLLHGAGKVLCIAQKSSVLTCAHYSDSCASSPQTQAKTPAKIQAWSSYS